MTRKENRPNETGVGEISRPTKGQIVQRTESDLSQTIIFANMRHELRTPLNAIIGYSELLIENAEELRQETFIPDLQKIHSASETFLGLIKEIVNFSKIKAGIMNAEVGSSETSDMVKGVVSTIRPLSEEDAIFVTADRSAILVVDDNEMNRDLLSRHLERQGHIITIAENGCQALEIIS